VSAAASQCEQMFPTKTHLLQLAFILPGILTPEKSPQQINYSDALLSFQTNALGPLLFMKHFSPFLPNKSTAKSLTTSLPDDHQTHQTHKGLDPTIARHVFLSARVGSVTDNRKGGWYSYRASKGALNQLVRTYDLHVNMVAGNGAMALALHPGTTKTDLSKEFWAGVPEGKLFEPDWVAEKLVRLCTGGTGHVAVGVEGRGRIWDYDGKEIMP
jgi:NAD(P)-dependent dehydrogenase (short-subunit alcohol dehydrogenase family)